MPEHDLSCDAGEKGREPLQAVTVPGQWRCPFAGISGYNHGPHPPAFAPRLSRCLQVKAGKQYASPPLLAGQALEYSLTA